VVLYFTDGSWFLSGSPVNSLQVIGIALINLNANIEGKIVDLLSNRKDRRGR